MAFDVRKNFALSTVATAPSPATTGTSLVLNAGDGVKFPTPPFNATIWPANAQPTVLNAEIVRVTAISTDTMTITRTQEGTTARTIVNGDQIMAGLTSKTLSDIEANFANFVDLTNNQTVAGNKTLSGATTTIGGDLIMSQLGLSKWRAAMQNVLNGTSTANLVLYGDSITQGYTDGSGTWANESVNATPARLRNLINQFTGYSAGDGINWILTAGTYTDTRFITGGCTNSNVGAFGVNGLTVSGVAQNFKFTPTNAGDTFVVYYLTGPTLGNFTAACASGTQTINTFAASAGIGSFTMPANASYATDQITITGVASATATILAIEFKATLLGSPGVKVSFCAAQGRMASDLVGTSASLQAAFDLVSPDLSIINFGANEYANQQAVATFKTNMQTLITRAKATGDVLIVATVPQSASLAIPLSSYTQALYQLAATNGIQVIDLQKRWQSYSVSNPLGLYTNGIHPSNNGYYDIANCYLDAITPFFARQGPLSTTLKAPVVGVQHIQQAWQSPSLGTGWANFDAGGAGNFGFPQYMKDSMGFVHLRGLAKNTTGTSNTSTVNALIFTLPAGYRPAQTMRMVTPVADSYAEVDVKNDGTVVLAAGTAVPTGGTGWVDLNAIAFLAEA